MLKKGVVIVVRIPDRVIDYIEHGNLGFDKIENVVLDEADEMLKWACKDIETILANTPYQRQTLLFSDTISKKINKLLIIIKNT